MAPSDDDPSTSSATPVPPRGAKRKPNRPTSLSGRSAGNRAPAANRATGASGQAKTGTGTGGQAGTGANGGQAGTGANGGATKTASSGPSKSASSGGPSARKASGGGANSPAARRRAALAQQRRKRQTLLAVGAIVVVIIVIAVFVIVKLTDNKTTNSSTVANNKGAASGKAGTGVPVPASVYTGFANVKPTALAAAANNAKPASAAYPTVANDPPISTAASKSTKAGLPVVFYYGAEFCPYCATERWAMVLALSKFGTFKNLSSIASTPNDSSGIDSVPTFTFYKSTYTSKYLKFEPVETSTVDEKTLQSPNKAQTAIVVKYDSGQTIPFVYFNGKAILQGAEYDPNLLTKGTFAQDAASIIGGTSALATAVYFNAGAIVSEICRMTGGKGPANVCKAFPKPITG